MKDVRLITPEDISKYPVEDVIAELQRRVDERFVSPPKSKFKYEKYERNLVLFNGIADLHPYNVTLPPAPPIEKFVNYGIEPNMQIYKRAKLPDGLLKLDKEVKFGAIKRAEAIASIDANDEFKSFIEEVWLKRLVGEWQLIGGKPTYISQTYFQYLNFWNMDIGLPHFRSDTYHNCGDLQLHYVWDLLVVPNPYCYGLNHFTQRRTGKTHIGGNILYEPISRSYEWHGGLQSKTTEDAEKAFTKSIVKAWRRVPFFFQPIYSNSTFPKKEGLQFTPRGKKGKNDAIESIDENELMSSITYASSDAMAYDGAKLHRYWMDECGKTVEVDVYERWNIVKPCLWENDGTGNKIKGKAFLGTTVEELEKKGGKYFKALFLDSDRTPDKPNKDDITVDENGETRSGLWATFTPSYCNEVFNKFGNAIVEKPTAEESAWLKAHGDKDYLIGGKERVDKEIEKQKNDLKKQEIIRKKPRNIREAFMSANRASHFNAKIINDRLQYFTYGYTMKELSVMKFGQYVWKDGVFGGDVEFVETSFEEARIHKVFLPNEESFINKRIPSGNGKPRPANTDKFCSASDVFKYNLKDVKNLKDASMGAAHTFAYFNPLIDGGMPEEDWLTDDFVEEYLYRPDLVEDYCEDMLKSAIYWGCKNYPENNLDYVAQYFKKHGFENYLQLGRKLTLNHDVGIVYKDETRSGATTNIGTIESMFRVVAQYVLRSGKHCKFYRTLENFRDVEIDNLNPYDLFVSASYCLMNGFDLNNPANAKKAVDDTHTPPFDYNALRTLIYFN
jgi:hypothetical protein